MVFEQGHEYNLENNKKYSNIKLGNKKRQERGGLCWTIDGAYRWFLNVEGVDQLVNRPGAAGADENEMIVFVSVHASLDNVSRFVAE